MRNKQYSDLVKKLVKDVVEGKFQKLVNDGRFRVGEIQDFMSMLDEYPGTLTMPPDSAYIELDMVESVTGGVFVDFDLWYDGKKSDLTLQAVIEMSDAGQMSIYIEDCHVL